jgi:predicted TIM-barrel fold metal-dependent hydrolase
VKSHFGEEVGFGAPLASEAEALVAFPAARAGDEAAYKRLYTALLAATLIQCQELAVPVHFHAGITGGTWNGPISDADPFLLVHLLRRPEFLRTKVVLLHGGYPWIQKAAAMAHAFPQVWVDMGWTTPWISLRIAECYRDVIGMAPLSKLMIGSGCHGTPEIAWLAGITAKIGLGKALGDAVEMGLMASGQAERVARMILHDNAARLYGLNPA